MGFIWLAGYPFICIFSLYKLKAPCFNSFKTVGDNKPFCTLSPKEGLALASSFSKTSLAFFKSKFFGRLFASIRNIYLELSISE